MWSLDVSCCDEETTALFQQGVNRELYEAITVAKYSREDSLSSPNVIVKSSSNNAVVVADCRVNVFKDTREICLAIELESLVECVAITNDSELLFIGEESGHVSIHHIKSQKRLIRKELTKPVEGRGSFNKIICYNNEGYVEVAILTVRGRLDYFQKIDLRALKFAIEDEKWGEVKNVLRKHEFSSLDLSPLYENSVAKGLFHSHLSRSQSSLYCYGSGQFIFGLDIRDTFEDYVYQFEPYNDVKKALFSYDGRYVFAIDIEGNFFVLCGETFTLIRAWNPKSIVDFTILESAFENERVVSQRKLVFLLKSHDSDEYQIVYKDFPSLKNCYKVGVANFCRLADPVIDQDDLYFVEGLSSKRDDNIDTLKTRLISEALPRMRLEKFIQKRKFEQAEDFARQFNLDLESVFKAHALFLASKEVTPRIMNKMTQLLSDIKDADFILDFGLKIRLESSALTRQIYDICIKILSKFPEDEALVYQKPILRNREKLDTFLLLFPDAKNWANWFSFCKKSISNLFLSLLTSARINEAFLVWNRHCNEILFEESQDFVERVLDCIPHNIESSDLISWLEEYFLQPVLMKFPDLAECLSNWIVKTSKLYEVTEKRVWPLNSVKLLSIFVETCSSLTRSFSHVAISAKHVNSSLTKGEFRELNVLRKNLEELEILRLKYRCFVSLAQYCQTDKSRVAFVILDLLIKAKKLERGIDEFLPNFFKDHDLKDNDVLYGFIEDSIRSQCVPWWYHDEAPWEYAALKVVPFITTPGLKTDAAKLILGQAPVPWSRTLEKFAQNCREDPRLKIDLECLTQRATLKRILIKYNLSKFDFNSEQKSYSLMFFILTQPDPESIAGHLKARVLRDALEVVKSYSNLSRGECYLRYAVILLERRKISPLLDFYADLDEAEALDCGPRILNFCEIVLQDPEMKIEMGDYRYLNDAAFVAKRISARLIRIRPDNVDFKLSSDLAKQIYNLQMEFNSFDKKNLAILDSDKWKVYFAIANQDRDDIYEENGCTERKTNPEIKRTLVERLTRLGDVLSLPKALVYGHIIEKLVVRNELDQAKVLFQQLIKSKSSSGHVLNVLKSLLTNEELFTLDYVAVIVDDLHSISRQLVLDCPEHLILEGVHLCQWTAALVSLYSLDPRLSFRRGEAPLPRDKYHLWKFSKIYRDQGMGISVKDILPNFLECLRVSCFAPQKMNLTMILRLFSLSRQITLTLRSRAQHEMALSLFVFLQSSFLGRALDNDLEDSSPKEEQALVDVNSEFKGALKEVCSSLITRIISQTHCDYSAGSNALTVFNQEDALLVIKNLVQRYAKDHSKLKSLSIICIKYSTDVKNQRLTDKIFRIYQKASWVEDLAKLKINCEAGLSEETIPQILEDLTRCAAVESRQLARFCRDFSRENDPVFLRYFQYLVQSDAVQLFGFDRRPNDEDTETLRELLSKCATLAKRVLDKVSLTEILVEIFPKVNSYCYEALKFVCQCAIESSSAAELTVSQTWTKNLRVLNFLERYVRVSPASDFEREKWTRDHPDLDNLPEISSIRLPYHLMAESADRTSKIIDPELYPENLEEWLRVASIFEVNADILKIRMVKNYVSKWLRVQPKGELLLSQPTDQIFVDRVTSFVKDVTEMELVIRLVSWILKILPLCETTVELTRLFAEHGEKTSQRNENPKMRKCAANCRTVYEKVSLEIVLRKYKMLHPRYLDLISNPRDLIAAILEDKLKGDIFGVTDKNVLAVVSRIARLRNCRTNEIYFALLSTWMPWGKLDHLVDDTFTMNLNQMAADFTEKSQEIWTDNLERTVNLLREIDTNQDILEHLKSFTNENASSIQRVQALICFLVAFDDGVIEEIMNKSRKELRELLSDLIFVSRLDEMRLPYPLEVFQEWNKLDLVKNILSFGSQNPKALAFASSLCIRENIWEDSVWETIFNRMISSCMNDELGRLLEQINHESTFWLRHSYSKAWSFVINDKIEHCQTKAEACDIYSLIYKSHCLPLLELTDMAKSLAKFGTIPALAIALLRPENKSLAILKLKYNRVEVIEEFESLMKSMPGQRRIEYSAVEVLLRELV